MRVRLISGQYGGRTIDAPDTSKTHPMSERIRNAMFNSLGDDVRGARVLDAFAGSGAVGFEALSRGASTVTFLERDRIAQKVIGANISLLGCDEAARLIKAPVASWSEGNADEVFDVIFADPPYHDVQFSTVSRLFSHLKLGGTMILSHPGKGEVPSGAKGIVVVDNRSYGNANLTFFRREV
jgi:16S rRNA (guanine966-N2)-methyltransferase